MILHHPNFTKSLAPHIKSKRKRKTEGNSILIAEYILLLSFSFFFDFFFIFKKVNSTSQIDKQPIINRCV